MAHSIIAGSRPLQPVYLPVDKWKVLGHGPLQQSVYRGEWLIYMLLGHGPRQLSIYLGERCWVMASLSIAGSRPSQLSIYQSERCWVIAHQSIAGSRPSKLSIYRSKKVLGYVSSIYYWVTALTTVFLAVDKWKPHQSAWIPSGAHAVLCAVKHLPPQLLIIQNIWPCYGS